MSKKISGAEYPPARNFGSAFDHVDAVEPAPVRPDEGSSFGTASRLGSVMRNLAVSFMQVIDCAAARRATPSAAAA